MKAQRQGKIQRNVGTASCYQKPMDVHELGLALKAARKAKGLTMKELAAKCNRSYQWIDHIEGGRREPSYENISVLAKALGMRIEVNLVPESSVSATYLEPEIAEIVSQFASWPNAKLDSLRRILPAFREAPLPAIEACAALLEMATRAPERRGDDGADDAMPPVQRRRA